MLYFYQSPELVARLKKLKAEQERAEYDRMVSNVDKKVSFLFLLLCGGGYAKMNHVAPEVRLL